MRFEPQGYTKNPDIRIAKSLIDYIFRWLGITFLPGYKEASQGVIPTDDSGDDATPSAPGSAGGSSAKGKQKSEVKSQKSSAKPKPPTGNKSAPGSAGGTDTAKRKGDAPTATLAPSSKPPAPNGNGHSNGHTNGNGNGDLTSLLARAGIMPKDAGPSTARSEQFADFQSDAPACDNCGSITIRAGNCYLCHNCGSSMGCS
jgi:ribonucleoside-diphosphate reductase alpha chain